MEFLEWMLNLDEVKALAHPKKAKIAPVAHTDIDRWLKSVDGLARDLQDLKKAKGKSQDKLDQIKKKYTPEKPEEKPEEKPDFDKSDEKDKLQKKIPDKIPVRKIEPEREPEGSNDKSNLERDKSALNIRKLRPAADRNKPIPEDDME
jgi:hypothetical protein